MRTPFTTIVVALVVVLLIGGEFAGQQGLPGAWALPLVQPDNPGVGNPSLLGEKNGLLTQFRGETVQIDGMTYRLAPDYVLAWENGLPFQRESFEGKPLHFRVRYWLGSGETRNQVTQLLIMLLR